MSPSGLRTEFLILTNVLAVRNGDLAGAQDRGRVTRGHVSVSSQLPAPTSRLCRATQPHAGPMGVDRPLGDRGALSSSSSVMTVTWTQSDRVCRGTCGSLETCNSAGVDAVGDHLLLALGCGLGHRSWGLSAESAEEPCPQRWGPLGQLPLWLGFVTAHSSPVVTQSRGACPGHPAFLARGEAAASCSRASAGWKRLINLISRAD